MKSKWTILILLIIDVAMIIMEWRALTPTWRSSGTQMLKYYTNSSNVLAMIVCALCALCEIVCIAKGCALPDWVQIVRYVSACCLMVTLIVACCILVPMTPGESLYGFMIRGNYLYVHTLCPLVMLAACMVHGGATLTTRHALIAIIPTVIYGVITLIMNAKRVYAGPYFFFEIRRQSWQTTVMWMTIIVAGNFAVAWLLTRLHKLISFLR